MFEGSYLGDASRLPANAVMECKICWHVYDPAMGCEPWQIPPGTPFADLPAEWRCPDCDGDREQFMVVSGDMAAPISTPAPSSGPVSPLAAQLAALPARLESIFREIHASKMRGLPMVNETIGVKAVGFGVQDGRVIGVMVTPWSMNLIVFPAPDEDWSGIPTGTRAFMDFPSGRYEFVHAYRDDLTCYRACSLFSPMFEFQTMLQATETARAIMASLFDPALAEESKAAPDTPPAPPSSAVQATPGDEPRPSRRALLFGTGSATERA